MLKEFVNRDTLQKRIAVCTSAEAFTQILERLLERWGFVLCRKDDPSVLLLVEEGCNEPVVGQNVICLSSSRVPAHDRISLPVKIDSLWQVLEQHFHRPPRMHLRMTVDLPVRVLLRGEWHETRLSSLSDMGARFISDCELVKQEEVSIELAINGMSRRYSGKVIFSMAAAPADEQTFQSGVVFHGQEKASRDGLRSYLISNYLEMVREKMSLQDFRAGLEFFDLTPGVRLMLAGSD